MNNWETQKNWRKNQDSALIKEEVTRDDIAEVVLNNGIPTKMLQSDRRKLLNLEEELHQRAGQEEG
jgi:ATP-dependent Clp protease ATP-binding subunit ClpB